MNRETPIRNIKKTATISNCRFKKNIFDYFKDFNESKAY